MKTGRGFAKQTFFSSQKKVKGLIFNKGCYFWNFMVHYLYNILQKRYFFLSEWYILNALHLVQSKYAKIYLKEIVPIDCNLYKLFCASLYYTLQIEFQKSIYVTFMVLLSYILIDTLIHLLNYKF